MEATGTVLISDRHQACVHRFRWADGAYEGCWRVAELERPYGIALGPRNLIYVVDANKGRVYVLQ